ncbi:MAG: class I SAM-dependent methyltransferase [Candidatus Helarchaeota archaeon]
MLQYVNQFAKYLMTLSKYNINSYLEIGVSLGGSFITTVEYLMKINPDFQYAVGIDMVNYVSMQIYAKFNKRIDYLLLDTRTPAFKDFIQKSSEFDLVFLDGNKSYRNCLRDFEIVRPKARMIALHDILQKEVDAVWKYIKNSYSREYSILEFTDQYLKNGKYLGIGLVIRKDIKIN